MKTIYTSENVKNTLIVLQRRYSNIYNRKFSIQQVIYAFNKLPGKHQDLLLKPNKNENDKATLALVYPVLQKHLYNAKNVPNDIKIIIKNINQEEEKKKNIVSIEDTETGHGDKWVKPTPETKNKRVIELSFPKKKTNEEKIIELKETKKEIIKEKETIKEIKNVESRKNTEELNLKIQEVVLEEYLIERQKVDIDSILDNISMDDEEKFIILIKYENNSVKTNDEVSKEIGLSTSYIDEVVEKFFNLAIDLKQNKIYALERK